MEKQETDMKENLFEELADMIITILHNEVLRELIDKL
jgi:hypothetical protein|tara:strand:+ start:366 stop:476 length:111 start_codon:yes stop_codon:yes gene_type:complete